MGGPPSPIKLFNSIFTLMLRWLDAEGICGVRVVRRNADGSLTPVDMHTIAFADDLLLMTESIADMRRLVALVDRFLVLFGISLQPFMSTSVKVGDKRTVVCGSDLSPSDGRPRGGVDGTNPACGTVSGHTLPGCLTRETADGALCRPWSTSKSPPG